METTTFSDHDVSGRLKLPVSINDFETMRTQGYVYVDKTPSIHRMVTQGKFYFLSRPRRFGKSVLITTLKCLYEGRKELFEGLWIAAQGKWDWQRHPVVLLDFTGINNETPKYLQQGLETCLLRIAKEYDIQLDSPLLMSKFTELILALSQKSGKPVAVLIDEYDKPTIDHLGKGDAELVIAKANRDVLKRFFGVLMLTASGADARNSMLTCKGRIVMAVFYPQTIYIIEFTCNQSPETVLQQIHDKGYAEPYRAEGKLILLIGIEFSTEQRNISGWKMERFETGKESV